MDNNIRSKIIFNAKVLFNSKGYCQTSITDICDAASTSRVTFYKYFKNKYDLLKSYWLEDLDSYIDKCSTILNADLPFHEKVENYIQFRVGHHTHMGKKHAIELSQKTPDSDIECQKKIEYINQMFVEFIRKAQLNGDINSDFSAAKILYFLKTVVSIAHDQEMIQFYNSISDMVRDLLDFYFYGIAGYKSND